MTFTQDTDTSPIVQDFTSFSAVSEISIWLTAQAELAPHEDDLIKLDDEEQELFDELQEALIGMHVATLPEPEDGIAPQEVASPRTAFQQLIDLISGMSPRK